MPKMPNLGKVAELMRNRIDREARKKASKEKEKIMSRPGLYANIHAKRKRGGKMRKKGAKGAPKASDFKRAKQTARS